VIATTTDDSALEVFLNGMRYINPRFTYFLYLLTTRNGKIGAQNDYIATFGCRLLSQSSVDTDFELAVVDNHNLSLEFQYCLSYFQKYQHFRFGGRIAISGCPSEATSSEDKVRA